MHLVDANFPEYHMVKWSKKDVAGSSNSFLVFSRAFLKTNFITRMMYKMIIERGKVETFPALELISIITWSVQCPRPPTVAAAKKVALPPRETVTLFSDLSYLKYTETPLYSQRNVFWRSYLYFICKYLIFLLLYSENHASHWRGEWRTKMVSEASSAESRSNCSMRAPFYETTSAYIWSCAGCKIAWFHCSILWLWVVKI